MAEKVILCVDDEDIILQSLKTELFYLFGNEYAIETAESGTEALEVFSELMEKGNEVPVVIIDYIMPVMKGDELSKQIQAISPMTQKIILSGQATIEGIANAINYANLFRYIEKPWNREELKVSIEDAIAFYNESKYIARESIQLEQIKKQLEEKIYEKIDELSVVQDQLDSEQSITTIKQLIQSINLFQELCEPLSRIQSNMDVLAQVIDTHNSYTGKDITELLDKQNTFESIHLNEIEKILESMKDIKNFNMPDKEDSQSIDINEILKSTIQQLKNKLQQ